MDTLQYAPRIPILNLEFLAYGAQKNKRKTFVDFCRFRAFSSDISFPVPRLLSEKSVHVILKKDYVKIKACAWKPVFRARNASLWVTRGSTLLS